MVVFQAKYLYFYRTLKAMNMMRKDMALCDIVLTVGQQTIHAHRCVLAAASPYFNSLFLGNFNEAAMGNIDLSSVTQDSEAVEMIMDFIYTGEMNITENNLGAVIKLASFFLVEQLREFCLEFMNKSLNLRNCLRYFFYSQDYGYNESCLKTLSMIESRFHDFIIFEEASLDISPVELHFLLTNKVLQFCRVPDLLEFVLKWLLKEPTEKHFAVALDVIDYASSQKTVASQYQRENDLEDLFEKIVERQEVLGHDNGKKFLRNFKKVMSRCCSPGGVKTYNLRPHSPLLWSKQEGRTEMALVAFAPRACVAEAVESRLAKGRFFTEFLAYTEPVFDLCVYLVSNQTWYHVQQLEDEGIPGTLLDEMTNGVWRFATMRDKLIFILLGEETMYFLDLRHMTWRDVSYRQLEDQIESNEIYYRVISVVGADQVVYLILEIRIHADDDLEEIRQVYFRCYRLRDNDEWEFVFDTPKYDTEDPDHDTVAMVSAGSNEMLIYSNNYVYLADMSERKPQPVQLQPVFETIKGSFESFHLLEGKNHMYVVKDSPQKVSIVYEYKLKSRKLVPVSATSTPVNLTVLEPSIDSYPCMNTYSVNDGTSLWRIEGSRQKTSRLTELRVARNKGLVQTKHTPPPFQFLTAVFAGRLDEDIISRLEPIVRYLSP